ncbi:hypothetical protein MZO42_12580 [Sphingomonas psychrotolerans]|uniref:Peptidase n=1 Tax=Sphingomonas psychrotolerans TaxID=1327635 RepID=A0ABU3N6P2_9SPHN|nr:hypothetical protein [Sphingomonas psychrotolerans]MDT8759534.1 hypothetical protein [Sphingomonas psychrotolerans]
MRRLHLAALAASLAGAAALGGCAEDGYGYSGVSLGYASGGYYDGYDPYYSYGPSSYFGWYGDYYYPGTGYYVYDRYRRPHRWNQGQQRYWYDRGRSWRGERRQNWEGFGRYRGERRDWRGPEGWQNRPERRYRRD